MADQRVDVRALAVETDTRLAELDGAFGQLEVQRARYLEEVHALAGDVKEWTRVGRRQQRQWQMFDVEALGRLADDLADGGGRLKSWEIAGARDVLHAINKVDAEAEANRAEASRLEAVHDEHGWSRFFLVLNNNGHLHSDISNYRCSRTPTTAHGWNPELSGATEEEAVAKLGPLLCTVCFPSAPVEWTIGEPKPDRCAGSGQYVKYTGPRYRTVYVECPECHASVARTSNGYVRAHKPKA